MDHFQPFRRISEDPHGYAIQWKHKNAAKVIGHFCSYTPQELIHAAGALPYRILSSGSDAAGADGYLQAYCCSLVRGGLEDALAGRLDFLDGTVFPHTCDSIQRLSDIWRMNAGFAFHADLVMPVKLNTPSAAEYMHAVLAQFQTDLEKGLRTSPSAQTNSRQAIRTCNRVRRSLAAAVCHAQAKPARHIGGSDLHAVFKAALVMDRCRAGRRP
jgi:benzoyl-CoA reductase subunit C